MGSTAFNVLNSQVVVSQKTQEQPQDLMLTFLVPPHHLLPLGIMRVFIPASSVFMFVFLNLILC